jgi:signal transduction histidine kinase
LAPKASFNNFFARTLHIAGVGMALVLGLFSLTLFAGKVPGRLNAAVTLSALFSAVYFTLTVSDAYGFELSMLTAHRIADLGVWLSILLLAYSLHLENLIGSRFFKVYAAHVALALAIIALADSGDAIQLGTSLPFAISLSLVILPLKKTLLDVYYGHSRRRSVLQSGTLLLFALGSFNEIFSVSGVLDTPPLFPLAYTGSVFFLALAVNERISDTYRERDYLRAHLESEVERKTLALKEAQAELVQSAKLASLGTLSAGIAHEINNSLNYVNGALQPLERLVLAKMPEGNIVKTQNLFAVMKEGLQLTVEIVRSLRSYTGLNQAKFNDVSLRQVAETTLTILRSKLRGRIETQIDIDPDLKVFGSVVGLNQVLMNLLTNAIDAMPDGGKLHLSAKKSSTQEDLCELIIRDTGMGMDQATQSRIFEPFFTTKAVGSGTGLGLHIVMNEVRRHHGHIRVQSTPGEGTSFTITLPRQAPNAANRDLKTEEAA